MNYALIHSIALAGFCVFAIFRCRRFSAARDGAQLVFETGGGIQSVLGLPIIGFGIGGWVESFGAPHTKDDMVWVGSSVLFAASAIMGGHLLVQQTRLVLD